MLRFRQIVRTNVGKRVENTNQVWVYLSDELNEMLRYMAAEKKLSMSAFIRKLIQKEIRLRDRRQRRMNGILVKWNSDLSRLVRVDKG